MSDKCVWGHEDCFAYGLYRHCKALSETDFDFGCPFYQTIEQHNQSQVRALDRLYALGRKDLIDKYEVEKRMLERGL